jgi:hypothetical protein
MNCHKKIEHECSYRIRMTLVCELIILNMMIMRVSKVIPTLIISDSYDVVKQLTFGFIVDRFNVCGICT